MTSRVGQLEVSHSARGLPTYRLEIWHDRLKKHRVIKGPELHVVERKAELQIAEWEERWTQAASRERDRRGREGQKKEQEANKKLAADRTAEAQRELDRLRTVLHETLAVNDVVDWEQLKDRAAFPEPKPSKPRPPSRPQPRSKPLEPAPNDGDYQPRFGLLDKLMASRREVIIAECSARFARDHQRWEQEAKAIDAANSEAEAKYQDDLLKVERAHQLELDAWEQRRAAFLEKQRLNNEAIEKRRAAYMAGSPEAVAEYCDMVLSASSYPDYFPQEYTLDYNSENKILVVDYALPAPSNLPTLREVRFIASRREFVEQQLPEGQAAKLYDDLLYQIVLRTVHELLEADEITALGTVVFNGFVTSIDRRTGNQITACVLSLQARREEFLAINLANVDPKACFKSLKGVGSSQLHSLAAVPPIMKIRRDDGRFVAAHEVASTLDESFNLAAMDWQDFEHLIRQLFEQEFSTAGGEVKITQASRDGGVDAVAFDPDPIRGGKIIIQAKRYAYTVGVGAVRDLYGTVMNEGANKGILVTTSDYGPDAYAFANGKPLLLLNGANLLHMLEKHGHRARIDLQEARRIAMSQPARDW